MQVVMLTGEGVSIVVDAKLKSCPWSLGSGSRGLPGAVFWDRGIHAGVTIPQPYEACYPVPRGKKHSPINPFPTNPTPNPKTPQFSAFPC